MNIEQFKKVLPNLLEADLVPLLIGNQGVGKSSIIKQYAKENGYQFIDLRLGNMVDPGDLTGMPYIKDGRMHFAVPSYLPMSGKAILFLDEVNRAPRNLLQAIFQLTLDKRIGEYRLPPECKVIAAMNPANGKFVVTDLADPALISRFVHIKLVPSVDGFAQYMGADSNVARFVQEHPSMLLGPDFDVYNELEPCGRSWEALEKLSATSPAEGVFPELIMGMIGVTAAATYMSWLKNQEKAITAKDIMAGRGLKALNKYIKENRLDLISAVVDNLKTTLSPEDVVLTEAQVNNIREFLLLLPSDSYIAAINAFPTHEGVDAIGNDRRLMEKVIEVQRAQFV